MQTFSILPWALPGQSRCETHSWNSWSFCTLSPIMRIILLSWFTTFRSCSLWTRTDSGVRGGISEETSCSSTSITLKHTRWLKLQPFPFLSTAYQEGKLANRVMFHCQSFSKQHDISVTFWQIRHKLSLRRMNWLEFGIQRSMSQWRQNAVKTVRLKKRFNCQKCSFLQRKIILQ